MASKLDKLRKKLKGREAVPHLSELVEQFLEIAGGPRAVAKMLFDEWGSADKGGLVRTRIMQLLLAGWKETSRGKSSLDSLGLLSDEDVESLLEERLGRLGDATAGGVETGDSGGKEGDQPGRPA